MYYDTTTAPDTTRRHISAHAQESKILAYFRLKPLARISPSQVHAAIFQDTPITSVRRGIHTLTRTGHLIKLTGKTMGPYGHAEHYWILNPAQSTKYEVRGTSEVSKDSITISSIRTS